MNPSPETNAERQQQSLLRRMAARERSARVRAAAFTLIPVLLVGTLVTLSTRWVGASEREASSARVAASSAREEAERYKQALEQSARPSAEMASEILQYQRDIADRDEQLKAATEKAARLEEEIAAGATSGDSQATVRRYEEIIRQKDRQITEAREAGRAAEADRTRQLLDNLTRQKDREMEAVKADAQREMRAARDDAARAVKDLESRLGECQRQSEDLRAKLPGIQKALDACRRDLERCADQRPSDDKTNQALKEAARWKEETAKCWEEVRRLRERLQQYERQTPP